MERKELSKMGNAELIFHLFSTRDNLVETHTIMKDRPSDENLKNLCQSQFEDYGKLLNEVYRRMKNGNDGKEELGIDLVTLFKATKGIEHRSVYSVEEKCEVFVNTIIYYENDLIIKGYAENSVFLVKDYGKTWALTKEETENEIEGLS